nr:transketolase [Actinoallomurus sp.]
MVRNQRVAQRLNAALHTIFDREPRTWLLGEDVVDPYGGAFKITKGLSTRHPGRVLATPISENAIVGVANGLALCGDRAIVEIMFGDFITLAFDQILNVSAKSVGMFGRRRPMRLVVRCPVGGGRGYGPTHSQSLQKHFLGIPDLLLAELSPFHDPEHEITALLEDGRPAIFFEDKILYTERGYRDGVVDDLFRYEFPTGPSGPARVFAEGVPDNDCLIIAPGGLTTRVLEAARELLLQDEVVCQILVPSRLWPLTGPSLLDAVAAADPTAVCVVEEGPPGGSWGDAVAGELHRLLWNRLRGPVGLVASAPTVVPTASHLEEAARVRAASITSAVRGTLVRDRHS